MKRRLRLPAGGALVIIAAAIACRFVWPPDLLGRTILLASTRSQGGEIFRIVQSWGEDFYKTRLEQMNPDGSLGAAVIDGDDRKQWSCSVHLVEMEKKLVIALPAGSKPVEYRWDRKQFVLPPGQTRLRE